MADLTKNSENKLKIGILARDPEKPENWQYRILQGIIKHPDLELSFFLKDDRKQIHSPNFLLAIQQKIESLVFKKKQTAYSEEIISKIKETETIIFTPEKSYDLDIILQLEFNPINSSNLHAARYGVWSFHFADYETRRGGPVPGVPAPGFWEIVNDEPCCCITLMHENQIIDKAWFNRHWSYTVTKNDLLEESAALLFKNIDNLLRTGKLETKKPLTYYNDPHIEPNLKYILKYAYRFYLSVFKRIMKKLFRVKRSNCWTLFINKGNFLESALHELTPVSMPKNVFWADPFLYKHENSLYVIFENYSYKTRRGKISAAKVIEEKTGKYSVTDVQDVFDFNYHLSYPHIIDEDGQLYLIPETYQNKRLEVYRCIHFPGKWELYATAFKGEEIVDTTYFRDEKGDKWLFINKGCSFDSELHIYKIDSLKLENITAHRLNPVILDCRKARSGGAIFKLNNEYYRPSQINTYDIYGRGLQISKIRKLTLDEFEDENVISIEPNFLKGLIGIHHLHQLGNNFVFDACFKKL